MRTGCLGSARSAGAPRRFTGHLLAAERGAIGQKTMNRTGCAVATILLALAGIAWAESYKIAALEIAQPWSRATPKGATIASGYMKLRNGGTTPDRLLGGTFALSGRVEIHEMSMDQGVMKMRELKGGIEIRPGATLELKPGSYHLMFTNLTRPLAKGDRVKGTLVFEKAGTLEIEYAVEAIGAVPSHGHGSGH
jgi:copper(I)-binding protein